MDKPRLGFWQIWNMSFGFLGIQFGFGLQGANMSAIYAKLGAEPDKIPLLWLAGPMTGLLVQPIIGSMSDRTWNWLGRRRPYFLAGAILASLALFLMPDAPSVRVAAAILWALDLAINVSLEPFRAFVADRLPEGQRMTGFVTQSFFIGVGAAVANAMPALFAWCGVTGHGANGVPVTVRYAFQLGAVVLLLAVLWTVVTSREYPPEDMLEFRRRQRAERSLHLHPKFLLVGALVGGLIAAGRGALVDHALSVWHLLAGAGIGAGIGVVLGGPEVSTALREMPRTMKQLAAVQFFTWMGIFCMGMFFTLATAQQVFGTTDPRSSAFDLGTAFGGQTLAWYSIVCLLVAFALPPLTRIADRRLIHSCALVAGGLSLLATGFIHDRLLWQCTMIGFGLAWASILSVPYAILSGALPPARVGVYMGIFNFFIVIPEIIASLTLEPLVKGVFGNHPVNVVMLGGSNLLVAAVLTWFVQESTDPGRREAQPVGDRLADLGGGVATANVAA